MLSTQISYWANKENARHNLVNEEQNYQDLVRKRDELNLNIKSLDETIRHNKELELISKTQAAASIAQAEASKAQAKTAAKKAAADVAVAKANVELAKANVRLSNSKTLLTNAQTANTRTTTSKTKQETKKSKVETKLTGQRSKYFVFTDIINPMFGNIAKVVSAVK
jgi:multidrug resistance efflux pump